MAHQHAQPAHRKKASRFLWHRPHNAPGNFTTATRQESQMEIDARCSGRVTNGW